MKDYAKFEVNAERYDAIKNIQTRNGTPFNEHRFGSRKNLWVNKSIIASTATYSNLQLGELPQEQFVAFLAGFNRHLYTQFDKNPTLFDLKIQFNGISKQKNTPLWNSMKIPSFFYNIDLDSAYWQIAHRLGYISNTMFERYKDQDEYKQAKRYCISFLARTNSMSYANGYEIQCDISPLQRVYDNIRNELYLCIQKCVQCAENCVEYNIDGLSVLVGDIQPVKNCLYEMKLDFKITECVKISPTHYRCKGKERLFCTLK